MLYILVRSSFYTDFETIKQFHTQNSWELGQIVDMMLQFMTVERYAYNENAFNFLRHVILNGLYDASPLLRQYDSQQKNSYKDRKDCKSLLKFLRDCDVEAINYGDILDLRNGDSYKMQIMEILRMFHEERRTYLRECQEILKEYFGDVSHIIKLYL